MNGYRHRWLGALTLAHGQVLLFASAGGTRAAGGPDGGEWAHREAEPVLPHDRGCPPRKAALLAEIARAWAALEREIDGATAEQLCRPGRDGWSAKDHLAHLAAWERALGALLHGQPRHLALGVDASVYRAAMARGDADPINALVQRRERGRPLDEVRAELRRAHGEVLAALARLSEADLRRPYADYAPRETGAHVRRPLHEWIGRAGAAHFAAHRPRIAALVGETAWEAGGAGRDMRTAHEQSSDASGRP
ncbi:MAG TPA: DinB family protein [Thermomicrobiales bacterium]|nr:DinB family protein [Thermomicrobiales bacterium]